MCKPRHARHQQQITNRPTKRPTLARDAPEQRNAFRNDPGNAGAEALNQLCGLAWLLSQTTDGWVARGEREEGMTTHLAYARLVLRSEAREANALIARYD